MPQDQTIPDGLEEVREWNRLFLVYLRDQLVRGQHPPGLPRAAARALGKASAETIERLAEFPQALFRLRLAAPTEDRVMDLAQAAREPDAARQAIQLALLVSARSLCRKSPYAARLYLRLSDAETRRLGETPFGDLPALSLMPDLVTCAYRELSWMWAELLAARKPESKRRLLLLGLQPRIELNAPISLTR